MRDLSYNIETLDWDIEDGDFVITEHPSVQNGAILLEARAFSSTEPIYGIGINQVRGGSTGQANYEYNRWKQQVVNDGGRASVKAINGGTEFQWRVNYE